jgi:hypothetical protein
MQLPLLSGNITALYQQSFTEHLDSDSSDCTPSLTLPILNLLIVSPSFYMNEANVLPLSWTTISVLAFHSIIKTAAFSDSN